MTEQEKLEKLAQLVADFKNALNEAEIFANEHDLDFCIQPAYGMGGWYDGVEMEWNPSSQSC